MMIQKIFFDIAETTIAVSVLIGLVACVMPFLETEYGAGWRKALWLILAVRLLIPYNFSLPGTPVRLLRIRGEARLWLITPSWALVLAFAWLGGVFLYWGTQFWIYRQFRKRALLFCSPVGEDVFRIWERKKEKLCVRRPVELYRCGLVRTPMVMGVLRPALLLPEGAWEEAALEAVFCHELYHVRNRDGWYKLLFVFVTGLHWFNPLIHWMARLSGRDVELVCDSCVTKGMDREGRRAYAAVILDGIVRERYRDVPATSCFYGGKRILKKRIDNVLDMQEKKPGYLVLFLILLLFAALCLVISCGYKPSEEGALWRWYKMFFNR